MALIAWNKDLSVYVAEMDRQHRRLIDLVNDLNDAIVRQKQREVIGGTLDVLLSYTRMHFAEEEKLFALYEYPDEAVQKNEHKKWIDKVAKLKKQHDDGSTVLGTAVTDFLSDWLRKHIMLEDKKYGPFMNRKGVM
jgi:hemerythrin